MTEPTDNKRFVGALRSELVDAAERANVRRRRRLSWFRRGGLLAVLVALVAGAGQVVYAPATSASVLRIESTGDRITVTLTDLDAKPTEVADELDKAGLDASVMAVPVADPVIGRFVALDTGPALTPLTIVAGAFRSFVIDTQVSRTVTLSMGRKADVSEPFAAPYDAYAVGGPLHCSGLWGTAASDAATKIATRFPYRVMWKSAAGGVITSTTPQQSPALVVVDVQLIADDQLLVFLSDVAESPFVGTNTSGPTDCLSLPAA